MNIRKVNLHGGPSDGTSTIVSHSLAIVNKEVYIWDGGEDPNRFIHALTAASKIPKQERDEEVRAIKALIADPSPENVPKMDQWRFLLWSSLVQYGVIE